MPIRRIFGHKSILVLWGLLLLFPVNSLAKKNLLKATEVEISLIDGVAVDQSGRIYFSQHDHNSIMRVNKNGTLERVIGTGSVGFAGDGGLASKARLKQPAGLVFDSNGNLYIADRVNHRVRKVDTKGIITTVAGNGQAGFSGDGGPATQASLNLPAGVAVDQKGNLYIADRSNNRIRIVDSKGTIQTFAGTGVDGWKGDGGPAKQAQLNRPFGLNIDKAGNLYIADRGNNVVRKIDPNGIISLAAGDGGFYFIGDNGPAYRASIAGPTDVATDSTGNLYIADRNNNRIRIVDTNGLIRTIAGTGQQDYNGDSEVARETNLHLPFAVAMDGDEHLVVVDRSHYNIRRINLKSGQVETVAGNGKKRFKGDGGPSTGAGLYFPHGMFVDKMDNLIFSDKGHWRLRKISTNGTIETIAGNGIRGNVGDGGPVMDASLYGVTSIIRNDQGEIFILSPSGFVSLIRKIDQQGVIHHYLSTADENYLKGIKTAKNVAMSAKSDIAAITQISDIAFGKGGDLYFSDRINHQIRKIGSDGTVTTIAGTGSSDFSGDGGPAIEASFSDPSQLAFDKSGNLYIGDISNNRIRRIDAKGIVTTFAGNGSQKDSGDEGPALKAGIRMIDDLAFDAKGNLYIVSGISNSVRKISKDGKITTVAGKGYAGYFGDSGPATKAMLKQPSAIAFDSKDNMFISDMGNNRIRKVDTGGVISTIAGTGIYGWAEDGETVEILFQNFP